MKRLSKKAKVLYDLAYAVDMEMGDLHPDSKVPRSDKKETLQTLRDAAKKVYKATHYPEARRLYRVLKRSKKANHFDAAYKEANLFVHIFMDGPFYGR